jgi:periplasmic divalent cation tolerance protein
MSANDPAADPGGREASRAVVVLLTGPTAETLRAIGGSLVAERLAACVNVLPGVKSIYRWEGAVEESEEALAIVKTTAARLPVLEARVGELHPYELPEILAIEPDGGSTAYLNWIRESVTTRSGDGAA